MGTLGDTPQKNKKKKITYSKPESAIGKSLTYVVIERNVRLCGVHPNPQTRRQGNYSTFIILYVQECLSNFYSPYVQLK